MSPPRIPLTTWPGGPAVSIPDVETCDVLALVAAGVLVYGNAGPVVPVRDEFVFDELLDFDCDDVASVAAFEREFGRLGVTVLASMDHEHEHFPPFIAAKPPSWAPAPFVWTESWRRSRRAVLHAEHPDLVSAEDMDEVNAALLEPWADDTEIVDLSMTVRALRSAALHLEAADGTDPDRAIPLAWREHGFGVKDADDAWRWFGIIVNDRLNPFHMCVLVPGFMDESKWWEKIRLENALALQLRNYVAENASFRRCENERCGKAFAVGFGGTKRKKFRSDKCARRQGMRESRKRGKERAR